MLANLQLIFKHHPSHTRALETGNDNQAGLSEPSHGSPRMLADYNSWYSPGIESSFFFIVPSLSEGHGAELVSWVDITWIDLSLQINTLMKCLVTRQYWKSIFRAISDTVETMNNVIRLSERIEINQNSSSSKHTIIYQPNYVRTSRFQVRWFRDGSRTFSKSLPWNHQFP